MGADRTSGPNDGPALAVVPARAALAGNPSDGHGGAVVAIPLPRWCAITAATPAATFGVSASSPDGRVRASMPGDDLWKLATAACRSMAALAAVPAAIVERVQLVVQTSIPRSVGLAGSSAIALGVIRAIAAIEPDAAWSRRLGDPDTAAVIAHHAEVVQLGIAAGMQDRLVQAHGRCVLMDFSPAAVVEVSGRPSGTVTRLPAPPGEWLVAYRRSSAESSGVVHAGLGRRNDTDVAMSALASAARRAATAIRAGDVAELGAALDATFELRASILTLDPRHVEMIDAVRRGGGHANYTGSGGAVIALCADGSCRDAVEAELSSLAGCVVERSPFAGPP